MLLSHDTVNINTDTPHSSPTAPARPPLAGSGLFKLAQPVRYWDSQSYRTKVFNVIIDIYEDRREDQGIVASAGRVRLRINTEGTSFAYDSSGTYSCYRSYSAKTSKPSLKCTVDWGVGQPPKVRNIISTRLQEITGKAKDAQRTFKNYTSYVEAIIKAVIEGNLLVQSLVRVRDVITVYVKPESTIDSRTGANIKENDWVFLGEWLEKNPVKFGDVIIVMSREYTGGDHDTFMVTEPYNPQSGVLKGIFSGGRDFSAMVADAFRDMERLRQLRDSAVSVNVNTSLVYKRGGIIQRLLK